MRMSAVLGGSAAALIAATALIGGAASASAAPGDEAIVNSTCTYPQVIAALNDEDPAAANELATSPLANGFVRDLVNAPPAERQQKLDQFRGYPQVAQYSGLISQVASTCNRYPA